MPTCHVHTPKNRATEIIFLLWSARGKCHSRSAKHFLLCKSKSSKTGSASQPHTLVYTVNMGYNMYEYTRLDYAILY